MKTVSVETMRWLDSTTISGGVPGEVLMDRAGLGAAEIIRRDIVRGAWGQVKRLVVLAGKGNNGGDGYVVARDVAANGPCPVAMHAVCDVAELRGEARHHAELLPANVPLLVGQELPEDAFRPGDLIVDSLLGTGTSGAPRAPYDEWIRRVNASGCPVVALDIPSGLNGDTGEAAGAVVQADLTITMAVPKTGLLSEVGRPCCGRLRCVDIGVPGRLLDQAETTGASLFAEDIRPLLARRPFGAHKGTCGWTLVLGGSHLYGGAPLLAGMGALRVGSGLVTVARPVGAARFLPPSLSLIVRDLPDGGTGFLGPEAFRFLAEQLPKTAAIVFGPGVGDSLSVVEVLTKILAATVPVVLDADGLRLRAGTDTSSRRDAGLA
jgi:NAD(P)H-hydrate epimerase